MQCSGSFVVSKNGGKYPSFVKDLSNVFTDTPERFSILDCDKDVAYSSEKRSFCQMHFGLLFDGVVKDSLTKIKT